MEYTIELGGRRRRLHYRMAERRAIEAAFPKPDNTPGELNDLVDHLQPGRGGSIEVQATIIWAGLRTEDPLVSVAMVIGWIDDLIEKGKPPFGELRWDVLRAIAASGVLGGTSTVLPTWQAMQEKVKGAVEGAEGKAEVPGN